MLPSCIGTKTSWKMNFILCAKVTIFLSMHFLSLEMEKPSLISAQFVTAPPVKAFCSCAAGNSEWEPQNLSREYSQCEIPIVFQCRMVCVVLERYKQKSFWACTEPKFFSPPCPSALCCGVSRVTPPDAGRESQGYPIVSSQPGWVLLLRGIQSALSAEFLSCWARFWDTQYLSWVCLAVPAALAPGCAVLGGLHTLPEAGSLHQCCVLSSPARTLQKIPLSKDQQQFSLCLSHRGQYLPRQKILLAAL